MPYLFNRPVAMAIVALVTAASTMPATSRPASAASPQAICYASWSDASPIVTEQRLMAVGELSALARHRLNGDIVRTTLCLEEGRYIYRVVLRATNGSVRPLTLDAREPFAH